MALATLSGLPTLWHGSLTLAVSGCPTKVPSPILRRNHLCLQSFKKESAMIQTGVPAGDDDI